MFAGGIGTNGYSTLVDIYNSANHSWTFSNISFPRFDFAATTVNGMALFGGGVNFNLGGSSAIVDVYFLANNSWSTMALTQARYNLVAATVGTMAVFAGGIPISGQASNVVDIFDSSTGQWTTHNLSIPRFGMAAAILASKLLLAGGTFVSIYATIDIYDPAANSSFQWTNYTLQTGIWGHAGASLNNTAAIFAGGSSPQISNIAFIIEEAWFQPTTGTTGSTTTTGVAASTTTGKLASSSQPTTENQNTASSRYVSYVNNTYLWFVLAAVGLCVILSVICIVLFVKRNKKNKNKKTGDIYF